MKTTYHYKYLNLITCNSIEEFQVQCVLNSYASMTVKQNLEFIKEAVKYAAEKISFKKYFSGEHDQSSEFEFILNKNEMLFTEIPIGFSTICNVILESTELDDLIKTTKFRKLLLNGVRSLPNSIDSVFEQRFYSLLLMFVCRKFPDIRKIKMFSEIITENKVEEFFKYNFRKIEHKVNNYDETH